MSLSDLEKSRYSRHIALTEIGVGGQEKLKAARVLIVGAGGLGSPAALYLAGAGVGTLGIADGDRVETSNLHRQVLFTAADVGAPKARIAQSRLRALNPDVEVVAHELRLDAGNVLPIMSHYDLIVDGSDRLGTRYLLNDACVILSKPLVSAAIHRFEGQAFTYVPNRGACYRCLFPQALDAVVPNCAEAGVLGVLPGVLGTIQATEAIKWILGLGSNLIGRFLTYDALAMRFEEFAFKRRADCAVCGRAPSILAPRDATPPDAADESPLDALEILSAAELSAALRDSPQRRRLALIDVREPREFALGHLAGSVNWPLTGIADRLEELPRDALPVFICRSGARSRRACTIAARRGIAPLAHLAGGLAAWAQSIDPQLKVSE
jgi:sulfur-carrier protein adenylyltransferase/sulfurtransferase